MSARAARRSVTVAARPGQLTAGEAERGQFLREKRRNMARKRIKKKFRLQVEW